MIKVNKTSKDCLNTQFTCFITDGNDYKTLNDDENENNSFSFSIIFFIGKDGNRLFKNCYKVFSFKDFPHMNLFLFEEYFLLISSRDGLLTQNQFLGGGIL